MKNFREYHKDKLESNERYDLFRVTGLWIYIDKGMIVLEDSMGNEDWREPSAASFIELLRIISGLAAEYGLNEDEVDEVTDELEWVIDEFTD